VREPLDACYLTFPRGQAPTWHREPYHFAESEAGGGPGSGPETIPGQSPVLAGPEKGREADVPRAGRVLRVIFCPACNWQYGAYWPRAEVYGYWGDCPHCGSLTQVAAAYRPESGSGSVSAAGGRAAQPAQQELNL
jgi:hypothetical protein